jgi:hypothetical protein
MLMQPDAAMDPKQSTPPKRHIAVTRQAVMAWFAGALLILAGCGGATVPAPTPDVFFSKSLSSRVEQPVQMLRDRARTAVSINGVVPTATQLLDWAEITLPALFPRLPTQASNQTFGAYTYRLYAGTDLVLGVNNIDNSVLAITQLSSGTPTHVSLGVLADYTCQVLPAECHADLSSVPLRQRANALAGAIGKPSRLLVGLGTTTVADIEAQSLKPDIYDQYLSSFPTYGHYSWDWWTEPKGSYIHQVTANAERLGAVPMFTLYQMATWGDGNIYGLPDKTFMTGYWDNVRLMFQQIKVYGKPVLVNFEPDFWGYAHRANADPTRHTARVGTANPNCVALPDTVAGMGECLVQMARDLAPNAYVGFPPSLFGDLQTNEVAYMLKVGASKADFVIMQTLDRDAGCYEAFFGSESAACDRLPGTKFYLDASNLTSPNFTEEFTFARKLHEGLGLPLLWWQTPLGVPSATAGGTRNAFRDNRAEYFLTRSAELVAAGSMGVVFSPGHDTQTNINTDGGQFKRLSTQYLVAPTALP